MTIVLMKGDTERYRDSYAQRKDHMETRGEGSRQQDRETGLRETKPDGAFLDHGRPSLQVVGK